MHMTLGYILVYLNSYLYYRCLPGSEGGAVFDSVNGGHLVGVCYLHMSCNSRSCYKNLAIKWPALKQFESVSVCMWVW